MQAQIGRETARAEHGPRDGTGSQAMRRDGREITRSSGVR
jgi:hypothetical protein